jgi:hypothetical protein
MINIALNSISAHSHPIRQPGHQRHGFGGPHAAVDHRGVRSDQRAPFRVAEWNRPVSIAANHEPDRRLLGGCRRANDRNHRYGAAHEHEQVFSVEKRSENFPLYSWTGNAVDAPVKLIEDLRPYTTRPEGVDLIQVNGQWRVLFVEDRFEATGYGTRNAVHWPVSILGNVQ